MSLSIDAIPTPLRIDADGSVRVGKTRVLLATVITAFYHGESAEEIAENSQRSISPMRTVSSPTTCGIAPRSTRTWMNTAGKPKRFAGRSRRGFLLRDCVNACWLAAQRQPHRSLDPSGDGREHQ